MSEELFRRYAAELAAQRLDVLLDAFAAANAACESPIERHLLAAMMNSPAVLDGAMYPEVRLGADPATFKGSAPLIIPQMRVLQFRIDFAVVWYRAECGPVTLAVECDGHDFHEKTKDQARRDKSRDRALFSAGWPVLRFTGQEIHEDAAQCADDVGHALFEEWVRRSRFMGRGD